MKCIDEIGLGYKFKNNGLLNDALNHSSIKKFSAKFERLEFLGDRILGFVIAEYIFRNFEKSEGIMSKMQAAFVCADSCYRVAVDIGVDKLINTAGSHLSTNKTVLADAMEAVLGALFIDAGYECVKGIILRIWSDIFKNYNEFDQEPKTQLQEICQANNGMLPVYNLISMSGPDHKPEFIISLIAKGETVEAVGNSKKEAETNAAKIMLNKIRKF